MPGPTGRGTPGAGHFSGASGKETAGTVPSRRKVAAPATAVDVGSVADPLVREPGYGNGDEGPGRATGPAGGPHTCQNGRSRTPATPVPEVPVTKPVAREPQRRNARSNRARILATARRELGRNPDTTLEELARAAGVVRRTLFGHFPGRAALLEALAEEASEALRGAMTAWAERGGPAEPAERALAHFNLLMWPVGDRYRMLLALARHDLGEGRVAEILAPARAEVAAVLERGQRDGAFPAHLPPAVLSAGLEAMTVALLEQVNTGALEDDGTRAATAALIAAGVPEARARAVVLDVASTVPREPAEATEPPAPTPHDDPHPVHPVQE